MACGLPLGVKGRETLSQWVCRVLGTFASLLCGFQRTPKGNPLPFGGGGSLSMSCPFLRAPLSCSFESPSNQPHMWHDLPSCKHRGAYQGQMGHSTQIAHGLLQVCSSPLFVKESMGILADTWHSISGPGALFMGTGTQTHMSLLLSGYP